MESREMGIVLARQALEPRTLIPEIKKQDFKAPGPLEQINL